MRNLFTLCSLVLLVACSSPKYAYHFDRHDYNSGKKHHAEKSLAMETGEMSPLSLNNETLSASSDDKIIVLAEEKKPVITSEEKAMFMKKYTAMTKTERKEFRKELKNEIRKITKLKKEDDSVHASAALDNDAKLAIIFGGIGVILLLLPGQIFLVLGAISLIIGFIFFVKWISRQ